MWWAASLLLLLSFYLCLCLLTIWPYVSYCGDPWIIMTGFCCISQMWRFMFFIQFEKFLAIISCNIFLCPQIWQVSALTLVFWTVFSLTVESIFSFLSYLSLWESVYTYVHTGWCPTSLLGSVHFSSLFSLSAPLNNLNQFIVKFADFFLLLIHYPLQ